MRSKVVKSEFAIKPGRQDGKLVIFQKKCAYGECDECGTPRGYYILYPRGTVKGLTQRAGGR